MEDGFEIIAIKKNKKINKPSYSHIDFYSINSQTTKRRLGLVTNVFDLCNRSEFSPLKLKNKENSSTVLITATFIA